MYSGLVMEVSLTLRIPESWFEDVVPLLDRPVKVLQSVPDGLDGGRGLIEIRGDDETTKAVVEAIRAHPSVCSVEFVPLPEGGVLGQVVTARCAACKALTGVDCFLMSANSRTDGRVDWNLVTGSEGSLKELVDRLVAGGCEVEIRRTHRPEMHRALTDRQEEILRLSLRHGYYDQPKRITIKELAKRIGIAPSTFQEILQRAERKVMMSSLEEG
jgi:predicted DNA binding protein